MPDRENDRMVYYFLAKDNPIETTRISAKLVNLYVSALEGNDKDKGFEGDFEFVREVCASFHTVMDAREPWGCIKGDANPCNLICDCKGCKGHGICSHVLAINHMLQKVDMRAWLGVVGKKAKKKGVKANRTGGNGKKMPPAWVRGPQMEPDSSDEEEERLLIQGRAGK